MPPAFRQDGPPLQPDGWPILPHPPPFRPHEEDRPFLRRLMWLIVAVLVLVIIWRASDLLLLAFGSVIGAVLFRSAGRLFQRIGIRSHNAALMLGMILVLAGIGLLGWLLTVQFGSELATMLGNLPGTIRTIEAALSGSPVGQAIVQAVHAASGGGAIASRLASFTRGAGEVLLNFLIVIVGAMFIASNPAPYLSGIVQLTPPPARPAMEHALKQVSKALRLWLKAKLLSMLAMATMISAGLYFAGMKSWAALGLLGGLSEFVPYVGPTVAMVPTIGIAAAEGGDVLWRVLVAYAIVRVIEAYALTPGMTRSVIKIPPALTLFTILGAGAVFGFYGLFFAGALLVVGFVAVRELYLRDTLGEDVEGLPAKHDAD